MKCRGYIFPLSSGQLQEVGRLQQLAARQHRMVRTHCRALTRNDAALQRAIASFKEHLEKPDQQGSRNRP